MSRAALVTGGSRGIGLGIVHSLLREGYDVAINGIRPEEDVETLLTALETYKRRVIYCRGNIRHRADREKIQQEIHDHFGKINLLVNNAGIAPPERKDILEATEEQYDLVMETNLKGPYFLTQAVANWMISLKAFEPAFPAAIVNISSVSATIASVNRGEYCLSKAGISMATQLFAARLGEYDIPVFEVRPGIIKTDMTEGVKEKYDLLIGKGLTVQKRWGAPEDVGRVVAAIARNDFSYSTGQVFMVDGGLTLARL